MWNFPWLTRRKGNQNERVTQRCGDLTTLPQDALSLVLSRLSQPEIANIRLICHAWRTAVDTLQTSLILTFPVFAITSPVPVDVPPLQLSHFPGLQRLIMTSIQGADTNITGLVNTYLSQQHADSLNQLKALHLVNVNLPVLPHVVCQLSGLQALDLSRNMLAQWPGVELSQLSHLTSFRCCHSYLAGVPKGLSQLVELQVLDLSDNQLPDVWSKLDSRCFPALRVLGLERVGMEVLSEKLMQFTRLEDLKISGNLLQSFPAFLTTMTRLRTLEISHAYFRQSAGMIVPESISALTNLQRLAFGNASSSLQVQHVSALQGLTSLDLQWTPSTRADQVPPLLLSLTCLTRLDLGGGALTRLPSAITELTGLMWLDVRSNRLKMLPPGFHHLSHLRGLWLQNNKLRDLPDGLSALKHLTILDLANNALSILPAEWRGLDSLRVLDLSKNKDLNLTHNLVTHLPMSISLLTALRTLKLGQNCLESVTACGGLVSLAGLHVLELPHNGLLELPNCMSRLVGLRQLDLSVNLLATLPSELAVLTGLRTLIVSRNKIREVPSEMGALTGLLLLDLSWNRLRKVNGNPMRLRFPIDNPKPRPSSRSLLSCLHPGLASHSSRSGSSSCHAPSDEVGLGWHGRAVPGHRSGGAGPSNINNSGFVGVGGMVGAGLRGEVVDVLGSRGRRSGGRSSPGSEGVHPWRAKVMRLSRPWSWVLWKKVESRHHVVASNSSSGQEQ